MADIVLSQLEEKLQLLLKKMQFLREENKRLEDALEQKKQEEEQRQLAIAELERQLTIRKIAATTASDGMAERSDLKRTLAKYIREIDRCIAQLNS